MKVSPFRFICSRKNCVFSRECVFVRIWGKIGYNRVFPKVHNLIQGIQCIITKSKYGIVTRDITYIATDPFLAIGIYYQ